MRNTQEKLYKKMRLVETEHTRTSVTTSRTYRFYSTIDTNSSNCLAFKNGIFLLCLVFMNITQTIWKYLKGNHALKM